MNFDKKNLQKTLLLIAVGVILFAVAQNIRIVTGWFWWVIRLFSPGINGLCIAFVLNVLLKRLEENVFFFLRKSKKAFVRNLCRPLCLFLTLLISLSIVSLLLLVIIPGLVETFTYLAENLPLYLNQVMAWIEGRLAAFNIASDALPDISIDWGKALSNFAAYFTNGSGQFFGEAIVLTASIFNGIINAIFSIIIAFYVLAKKESIGRFVKKTIDSFVPPKIAFKIYHIAGLTGNAFSDFITGQLMESVILGVLCFVGMVIFGFPNAGVISVVICITSLVPMVGAILGEIIGAFLILLISPFKAFLFLVFILVLHQIDDSFIYPKVVGKSVGLPGLLVLSAVLVGGNAAGVVGALAGVPVCAVLYVLLKEAIEKRTQCNNPEKEGGGEE